MSAFYLFALHGYLIVAHSLQGIHVMSFEFRAILAPGFSDWFKYNYLLPVPIILSLIWLNSAESSKQFIAGTSFSDCPEMVVIPTGSFEIGDATVKRSDMERPEHKVTLKQQFAIGKHELTNAQWDSCVTDGGCKYSADDKNYGGGQRLVWDISWNDAVEFVTWLAKKQASPIVCLMKLSGSTFDVQVALKISLGVTSSEKVTLFAIHAG